MLHSKAGAAARRANGVWRVHSAFDLPAERFAGFAVSQEKGGERLDRIAVEPGEIRVGDRAYLQPDRIAAVLAAGGDVVVRSGWRNAAWLDATGAPFDLIAALWVTGTSLLSLPLSKRDSEKVRSSGQTILVQVTKDPMGHKGARLTSQISLAGRFLVYVPDGTTSGISRKLPDTERNRLKNLLKEIVPESAGVIVRSIGANCRSRSNWTFNGNGLVLSYFEERTDHQSSRCVRSSRSWRSCASSERVAIGRASNRLIPIGSLVSSQ